MQPGPADTNVPNLGSGVNGWSLTRDGACLIHLAQTADKLTLLHEAFTEEGLVEGKKTSQQLRRPFAGIQGNA